MVDNMKILKGGDELFFHPDVISFYSAVINDWRSSKEISLLLGCTQHKPYSQSFIHRKIMRMLESKGLSPYVQQYIIGEPLVVVPREWEERYPAAHYDFPPELMTEVGEKIFIKRLNRFFKKAIKMHKKFIIFVSMKNHVLLTQKC